VRLTRPTDADLQCRKLGDLRLALYASPAYLAAHGLPECSKDLAGHTSVTYLCAPSWFSEALAGARAVFFSNSPFVQMKAVPTESESAWRLAVLAMTGQHYSDYRPQRLPHRARFG
jgi:DNA-binding transcriptional LysR family regulator